MLEHGFLFVRLYQEIIKIMMVIFAVVLRFICLNRDDSCIILAVYFAMLSEIDNFFYVRIWRYMRPFLPIASNFK